MSKGTKQIRLGRVERLLAEYTIRAETAKEFAKDEEINAYIKGMEFVINGIKKELGI